MAKKSAPLNGGKTAQTQTQKPAQGRNARGQFTKGNSGGGRPKVPEEIREAFQAACPEALDVLVAIMRDGHAKDNDRIRAAEVILERGYGKAPQSIDLDAGGAVMIQLSDEARKNGE